MRLIEVENVVKVYRPRRGSNTLLADTLPNLFRRHPQKDIVALNGVSFTVESGEAFGIIGANGSGKSTLLKLLSGVTVPTSGDIRIHGRVASLLELGAGFHPQLTGRENVFLNARILGMSNAHIAAVFEDIVEFSGIRDFLDSPVSTYSSGMYVRLGFAVAAYADPDVFLVDEVLSVGDEEFQRKCRTRIGELREQGKTMVFVSHDLNIVNTLCSRVVLLSRGKMISRGTPRQTIDFYLRQIGRESGIHTFSSDDTEVIFCHGRVNVFHKGKELTSSAGLQMTMQCLGQMHNAVDASWTIVERGDDYCQVKARMARIPVILHWDLRIVAGRLKWAMTLQAEQDLDLTDICINSFWPTAFNQWIYGDVEGSFPEIGPQDLVWRPLRGRAQYVMEAGAAPAEDAGLSPFGVFAKSDVAYVNMYWANSDYIMGARVLQISAQIPRSDHIMRQGSYDLISLDIQPFESHQEARPAIREYMAERVRQLEESRSIVSGRLFARFNGGNVHYFYDGMEISSFLHFYSSAFMSGLWNDSHDLQWSFPKVVDGRLEVTGESRRFPYRQHWEIQSVEGAIATRIWLEVLKPIDMNEYHATIVLKEDYTEWQTPHEKGEYPPFEAGQADWRHVNEIYAAGAFALASSPSLPPVALKVCPNVGPFRMTAINTGCHERGRVLQALRTPDAGVLHFEPGRYLYFDGQVAVGDCATASGVQSLEEREQS